MTGAHQSWSIQQTAGAVGDVPAMGWAWLELRQSLGYSCDRGIILQASGTAALGRSSQPGGAVVPSQQLVRNLRAAQSYKKVKKIEAARTKYCITGKALII